MLEFTRAYVAAGGKIQAGTDVVTGGTPGLSQHHEMEILVEAGLTPMQALKAATSWPAELLEGKNGVRGPAKIGAIRSGNLADLVVISADPLSDISNTKKIERVMKNGRWVELGYHPEYVTLARPARALAAAVFRARAQQHRAEPRGGRLAANPCGAGGERVYPVVAGSGRRGLGQDHVPQSAARRVRSPGRRDRAGNARPVRRAGAGTERRDHRLPFGRGDVFNPPPEGGASNTVYTLVVPR